MCSRLPVLVPLQSFVDFAYAGRETLSLSRIRRVSANCLRCVYGYDSDRTLYFHYQRDEPEMCVAYVKPINVARMQRFARDRERQRRSKSEQAFYQ